MSAKREKEKERRRARKMADEAWQAVEEGNLELAEKVIRRAVATQVDNARLWNDHGVILGMRGNDVEADRSFRYAIRLARDFAEPYDRLAALRAKQERLDDAVALQADAVERAPENTEYAERLGAYKERAERQRQETLVKLPWTAETAPSVPAAPDSIEVADSAASWAKRLEVLAWDKINDRLTREGCVLLPEVLMPAECAETAGLFEKDDLFVKTVVMDQPDFGAGVYRYFSSPIPVAIDGLRRALYPFAARLANVWKRQLGEEPSFPDSWAAFRDECQRGGQTKSTVLLLKYGSGGFNALHRDLRGRVFFPIQFAAVLSPRADQDPRGFEGGKFLLADVPAGPKAKRREIAAGLGDGILFCTRDRLVPIGGAFGLQPVMHGVSTITGGNRVVLGMPFHQYR